MLSSIQTTGGKDAERPRGLRRIARAGLIAAWGVFWLNTALFPCCEVSAAILGGHADHASQSASAAPPHHSDDSHSEPLDHSPDSPCSDLLTSDPPLAGEYGVLTPDRSSLEWFAVDAPVAAAFTTVHRTANFALARASPPPSLRLHLRTQRLLI